MKLNILNKINSPKDLKKLNKEELYYNCLIHNCYIL